MSKIIATRVILYDTEKDAVLAVHPTGRKWKNKEGGIATGVWNIPGGEVDEGESKEESAIREIQEECNIDLDKSKLKYLGFYDYTANKDLHFFFYPEKNIDTSKMKCESYFENEEGKMLPEVNGYSLFNLEESMEMFFPVLQKVLKRILNDWPQYFE